MIFVYGYFIAPWFPIIALLRLLLGKDSRAQTGNRFGKPSARRTARIIWLHAASVGELQSVKLLLEHLAQQYPKYQILVTTNNPTALNLAASWDDIQLTLQAAPLDSSGAISRFLDYWQPEAFINVEGELWPNRLLQLSLRNTPVVFVNARLSNKSAQRFAWFGLGKPMLMKVATIFCQDAKTAQNFIKLGVDETCVEVTRNLKSLSGETIPHKNLPNFQQIFHYEKTLLAASTHKGEDVVVLQAFAEAMAVEPDLKLILAPRHPKRGNEVARLIEAAGLSYVRRSVGALPDVETQVYLADTLGEMDLFYQLSAITFVAGSLVPKRGHTPYEPARFKSAIISGPYVENFTKEYQLLTINDGCQVVSDSNAFATAILALCDHRKRDLQVVKALEVLSSDTGFSDLFEHILAPLNLMGGKL